MAKTAFNLRNKISTITQYIDSFRNHKKFFESYNDQYADKIKDIFITLESTYENYIFEYKKLLSLQSSLESQTDIFSQLSKVLGNESSIAALFANEDIDTNLLDMSYLSYDNAYKDFYIAFTSCLSFLEEINSEIKNEFHEYHIGVQDVETGILKEFWLDQTSMKQLYSFEQQLFKLNVKQSKNGEFGIDLALKHDSITNQDLLSGLYSAIGKSQWSTEKTLKLQQNGILTSSLTYGVLSQMGLRSQKGTGLGKKLDRGRIYEILDKLRFMPDTEIALSKLNTWKEKGYERDTLPWLAGGDMSYFENGQVHQVSNKMITLNNWYGMGRINLSNFRTMLSGLQVLSNPDKVINHLNNFGDNVIKKMGVNELDKLVNDWSASSQFSLRQSLVDHWYNSNDSMYWNLMNDNLEQQYDDLAYDAVAETWGFQEDVDVEWEI